MCQVIGISYICIFHTHIRLCHSNTKFHTIVKDDDDDDHDVLVRSNSTGRYHSQTAGTSASCLFCIHGDRLDDLETPIDLWMGWSVTKDDNQQKAPNGAYIVIL